MCWKQPMSLSLLAHLFIIQMTEYIIEQLDSKDFTDWFIASTDVLTVFSHLKYELAIGTCR